MSFVLEINVFTIVALLVLILGIQLQMRSLGSKIDRVLEKQNA